MNKFRNILTILLITGLLALPQAAAAHVLLTSGNMGMILHIDPDDDPIAGQSATFFMEFKSIKGDFSLAGCRCQAFVYQNGEEVFFQTLSAVNADSPTSSAFQFKFPAKGTYDFKVQGDPIQAGAFDSFTLEESIDVEREVTTVVTPAADQDFVTAHLGQFAAILVVVALAIAAIVARKYQKRVKPVSAN